MLKIKRVGILFDFDGACSSLNHGTIGAVEGRQHESRAPERRLLCQSLARCVTPGKSSRAGLAPIDIKGSRVRLLGLLGLGGNSNTQLGRTLQRLWTNDANKAQSNLFIYLFIYLSCY